MRCQTFTEYKHLGNMALLDNIQNQLDSTVNSGVRRETVVSIQNIEPLLHSIYVDVLP